jgi:hypothetical protein
MNTDYDQFTPELVEKYFDRALFYGMWPGFFSHNAAENPYWQNPRWYDRDRPLFKKYIPLIRRVAEAGWRPIPHATCDNPSVLVERFGPTRDGSIYFTFLNDTAQAQTGNVRVDAKALMSPPGRAPEPLLGAVPVGNGPSWSIELGSQRAAAWRLQTQGSEPGHTDR